MENLLDFLLRSKIFSEKELKTERLYVHTGLSCVLRSIIRYFQLDVLFCSIVSARWSPAGTLETRLMYTHAPAAAAASGQDPITNACMHNASGSIIRIYLLLLRRGPCAFFGLASSVQLGLKCKHTPPSFNFDEEDGPDASTPRIRKSIAFKVSRRFANTENRRIKFTLCSLHQAAERNFYKQKIIILFVFRLWW